MSRIMPKKTTYLTLIKKIQLLTGIDKDRIKRTIDTMARILMQLEPNQRVSTPLGVFKLRFKAVQPKEVSRKKFTENTREHYVSKPNKYVYLFLNTISKTKIDMYHPDWKHYAHFEPDTSPLKNINVEEEIKKKYESKAIFKQTHYPTNLNPEVGKDLTLEELTKENIKAKFLEVRKIKREKRKKEVQQKKPIETKNRSVEDIIGAAMRLIDMDYEDDDGSEFDD